MSGTSERGFVAVAVGVVALALGASYLARDLRTPASERQVRAAVLAKEGARLQVDHPDQALVKFEEALSADPDCVEALRGSARCLCELGRHEAALRAADRSVSLEPDRASYTVRSVVHARAKRYDLAVADLDRVLADEGLNNVERAVQAALRAFYEEKAAESR